MLAKELMDQFFGWLYVYIQSWDVFSSFSYGENEGNDSGKRMLKRGVWW